MIKSKRKKKLAAAESINTLPDSFILHSFIPELAYIFCIMMIREHPQYPPKNGIAELALSNNSDDSRRDIIHLVQLMLDTELPCFRDENQNRTFHIPVI